MGSHTFEVEALLLVLPTTDYQKRVSVAISYMEGNVAAATLAFVPALACPTFPSSSAYLHSSRKCI